MPKIGNINDYENCDYLINFSPFNEPDNVFL
jgi:hypothetical protein